MMQDFFAQEIDDIIIGVLYDGCSDGCDGDNGGGDGDYQKVQCFDIQHVTIWMIIQQGCNS